MTPKEALIHLAGIRGCESYFSKDQLTALDMAIAELEIKQQSIELLAKTFGVPESQAEEMLNLVGEKHVSDDGARQVIKRMLNLDAREEHFPDSTKMMGDCISRLAAISIPVMPKEHRKDDTYEGGWNDALACVNNLPSVQPDHIADVSKKDVPDRNVGKWIPIINNASDPMPEERKVYLVTYKTMYGKKYVRDLQTNYVGKTPKYIGWSKKINGKVTAWMPLPEPYQENTE